MVSIMKISIIVPIFKVENYIGQCIESILAQTYDDIELILVDDGSPDHCGDICDAYAAKDGRIKVIHKENGGLSDARNVGVANATGEYILFLDGDDYWIEPCFLENLSLRIEKYHADVLCFNFQKVWEDRSAAPYFSAPDLPEAGGLDAVSHTLWIACAWNKAIRRTLFLEKDLHFIEGITSEDIDWCVRLALAAQTFDYISLCAVAYRQRAGSISQAMTGKKVQCLYNNIVYSLELTEKAQEDKKQLLHHYLAYQLGTLLQAIAQLSDRNIRKDMMEKVKPLLYLLAESDNQKVKLLYLANKLAGIRGCVALLRLRNRLG